MRRVPDGKFGDQFLGRKPVRKQSRARRKTHALEPAIEHPDDAHGEHCRAEAETYIQKRRAKQPCGHEKSRVRAIANHSIEEFGWPVKPAAERKKQAQVAL